MSVTCDEFRQSRNGRVVRTSDGRHGTVMASGGFATDDLRLSVRLDGGEFVRLAGSEVELEPRNLELYPR